MPSLPTTDLDSLRDSLAPMVSAAGWVGVSTGPGALAYRGVPVRCLEVVGDRLTETVFLRSDGQMAYRSVWVPPLAPSGPPGTADTQDEAELPASWTDSEVGEFRVSATPAGAPSGRYHDVLVTTRLSDAADFLEALGASRAVATSYNGPVGRGWEPAEAEAPYFLLVPGALASFQEWVEDQELGWGTCEVIEGRGDGGVFRALVEQADSRGDRYRYDVVRSPEGVAVEVRGKKDLVVQEWIWQYPLIEREWVEETEQGIVALRRAFALGPVDVAAGRFWGCVQLSTKNDNGSSRHTYHPTAGLILSEFTDVDGVPGRRELSAIALRKR